jgi:beta-aspartyl-dipeptidase (metallo-type)
VTRPAPGALLVRGARVFAPEDRGRADCLLVAGRIAAVEADLVVPAGAEVVDAAGGYLLPGFIDNHLHTLGGGGEAGPATRGPRLSAAQLLGCGITCGVGLLGVDGVSRRLEDLYAHTLALRAEGMAAYMLTGSYDVPPPTLTGSVQRDLFLVEPVIGVGEIAIGDHRGSFPSPRELARLGAEAMSGGRIVGKRGYVNLHVGDVPGAALPMLAAMIRESGLPAERFLATHIQRSRRLCEEALELAQLGAFIDLTTAVTPEEGFPKALRIVDAVETLLSGGVSPARVTVSSDGGGMTAIHDERGRLVENRQCLPGGLLRDFRTLAGGRLGVAGAAALFTANVADVLGFQHRRGRLAPGLDADLLLLGGDLGLQAVIAGGVVWQPDPGAGVARRRE